MRFVESVISATRSLYCQKVFNKKIFQIIVIKVYNWRRVIGEWLLVSSYW